jgi:hypothetical protein
LYESVTVADVLKSFRRNAVHVRQALELLNAPASEGRVEVGGGYIQEAGIIERYKRLSIPVRRALNDTDRASVAQAYTALETLAPPQAAGLPAARAALTRLHQELDSTVVLGGSKVTRKRILMAWLEAAAFYDKLDRDRAYDRMIDQWGKAAEGIGSQLMEDAAAAIVLLDEAVAHALGEPVILPAPTKTPPPPPDPKEPLWKRLKDALGIFRAKDTDA